ncbi:kinase-like protein [Rhizopogon vinicolor AM-OR11-026]|uniref:Kinase-like protein n=1 Tax=Rhizopogon vinicolor AM-OR11-026 TaxID=1314800 RepID=A0A1B7MIM6_9AGAM|nr:kinase-like protein [Rhizopogon vinicolor AM-OR11-026]
MPNLRRWRFVFEDNVNDLTSQIPKLGTPITSGSFGQVYRSVVATSKGKTEVAVKVFVIDRQRAMAKIDKGIRRELQVWLKLRHPTIVPLLGIAFPHPRGPFPALVSQWMPSGTLYIYLEKQNLTAPEKVSLGIADGLKYLHSKNVIHGDLHPGNVLIDGSGNPCLTDFGLATVVGNTELQWTTTTAGRNFDSRWRAPEVIGIDCEPGRPTFKSDIYSFGSVMLFIVSGVIPWKEKHSYQITVELSRRITPMRPENIPDDQWILIQRCWSWDPAHRPRATKVLRCIARFRVSDLQMSVSRLPVDLTGQILGQLDDYYAGGAFTNVFKCRWRRPDGYVAVKSIRVNISEEGRRRFLRETEIWAVLAHDNIVPLFGTTKGYGQYTALVLPWFQTGTLHCLITEVSIGLSIGSKLNLLHGIASGLHYLHCLRIVHGDITSSNIMVDIKEEKYHACLTDFGLATVLGGHLGNRVIEGSSVRPGAIRWTAPELLTAHGEPTTQNDMYSFGRVMFHVLTLVIPWHDIDQDYTVLQHILDGQDISRPESTPDITDERWREIKQCWSADASARPSALMMADFLKSELEALTDNDMLVRGVAENHRQPPVDTSDVEQSTASDHDTHSTLELDMRGCRQHALASSNTITLHPSSRDLTPRRQKFHHQLDYGAERCQYVAVADRTAFHAEISSLRNYPRRALLQTLGSFLDFINGFPSEISCKMAAEEVI